MELRNQATPDLREEPNDTQVAGLSPRAEDEQEASGEVPEHEAQQDEPQQDAPARRRQTENEVSEVEIPNVGRIMVRADADGYNEEVSVSLSSTNTQLVSFSHSCLSSSLSCHFSDDADSSYAGRHSSHRKSQTDIWQGRPWGWPHQGMIFKGVITSAKQHNTHAVLLKYVSSE